MEICELYRLSSLSSVKCTKPDGKVKMAGNRPDEFEQECSAVSGLHALQC